MKGPLIVSVLALVVSVVAFAGSRTSAPDEPRGEAAVVPEAEPDAELVARLDALAEENRRLRDRLAMLERRPAPVQRAPVTDGLASLDDVDALREEVREALASRGEVPVGSPELKTKIVDALTEIRKEEAVEKVRASQEHRTERLEEDVARIEEWLDLTPAQSNDMRTALLAQYDREAEVWRLWSEGVEDEVLGERKRSDGEAFRDDLGRFLTPEQLDTFWNRVAGGDK